MEGATPVVEDEEQKKKKKKSTGSIFRSEDMSLVQIILPREMVYACISELGEVGKLYFRDLNPDLNAYSRPFVSEVRRCDDIEKELRFFVKELERDNLKKKGDHACPRAPPPGELNELEATIERLSKSLHEVATSAVSLNRNMTELIELKYILEKTASFFDEKDLDLTYVLDTDNVVPAAEIKSEFGHVTGVILREKIVGFEQLLWRACRGNVHIRHEEIELNLEDPQTGERVYKCAFIVFFQGEHLRTRVQKICEGYHATLYSIPEMSEERKEMLAGVKMRVEDLNLVLSQTRDHRASLISTVRSNLRHWMIKVRKIKSIYHVMNQLDVDVTQTLLIGEGWVPSMDIDVVHDALKRGQAVSGCTVDPIMKEMLDHGLNPPTYFQTNKFTKIFQDIVSAYGVPKYKEINPALFTVITFPFLFSVMFGDAGDAIIMLIFALFLIAFEKRLLKKDQRNGVFYMFFGGRYIILLMALFSIYSGLMYNDFFSISVDIFGTGWYASPTVYDINTDMREVNSFELNPQAGTDYSGYPYPFGMDPVWMLAQNSITWLNSFKMKMSVIMGVSQMFFGICLSLINNVYFGNWVNIVCEFIPQVIFITSIFGYMNILIFYKWFAYDGNTAACAPTILVDMIDMFLHQYPTEPCYAETFYPTLGSKVQENVQDGLLLLAILCVPWILIPKPLILNARHKREMKAKGDGAQTTINSSYTYDMERTPGTFKLLYGSDNAASDAAPQGAAIEMTKLNEAKAKAMEAGGPSEAGQSSSDGLYENVDIVNVDVEVGGATTVVGGDKTQVKEKSRAHKERPDEFEEEEFQFGEVFVHQAIHTIEYCLGCVSHTASYLRLWALSLAHAELAEVLWVMVIHFAFVTKGYPGVASQFFLFPVWAVLTIAILLMMEGLSAFLHTLRLHWVEFQSKFYGGIGHKFLPYSYRPIIRDMWEEYHEGG